MKSEEIRSTFIEFFKDKSHTYVHSMPVIPPDDPTLMFANAGMNQFKDIFLGVEKRSYARAVNSQKCIRVSGKHNDLEEVGRDGSHHTFFEMLGNWSFGDYYKREAIEWAWELLTEVWGVPKERLYATVFKDDAEAEELWKQVTDIAPERILRFDEKENFWEMGDTGPCGPCSELHYDRGEKFSCGADCGVNCECGRYVEVWNLVFIQYNRKQDGLLEPLKEKHVDTGMGFERITAIMNNKDENYDTDIFQPIFEKIRNLTGTDLTEETRTSFRVIADHIRMLAIAICDGAVPSNEGRGYVVRRILRRGVRFANMLKEGEPILSELVDTVVDKMGGFFPELTKNPEYIKEVIRSEEEKFQKTLQQGNDIFEKITQEMKQGDTIQGNDVFALYDTYGFPADLVALMAEERGLKMDMQGFEREMAKQKERSRAGADVMFFLPEDENIPQSEFTGHTNLNKSAPVTWIGNTSTTIATESTVFYPESGGQKGDQGIIKGDGFEFEVKHTFKEKGVIIHEGVFTKGGPPEPGTQAELKVDETIRAARQKNHTATHLLHFALREKFGDTVKQQGSMVDSDRFTFDFTYTKKLSDDEIREIEDRVNGLVQKGLPVTFDEMSLEDAKQEGVIALFDEKYGETVRVVTIGDGLSRELCGGTHISNTAEIEYFKILFEEGISAGNRRIEACTGDTVKKKAEEKKEIIKKAEDLYTQSGIPVETTQIQGDSPVDELRLADDLIFQIHSSTGAQEDMLLKKIENMISQDLDLRKTQGKSLQGFLPAGNVVSITGALLDDIKSLLKDEEQQTVSDANVQAEAIAENSVTVKGIEIMGGFLARSNTDYMQNVIRGLERKNPEGISVVAADNNGSSVVMCSAGREAQDKGFDASVLLKRIGEQAGGGGGGSASFARGGGGDPEKTRGLLESLENILPGPDNE